MNFLQTLCWIFYKAFSVWILFCFRSWEEPVILGFYFLSCYIQDSILCYFAWRWNWVLKFERSNVQELVLHLSYIYNAMEFKYCKKNWSGFQKHWKCNIDMCWITQTVLWKINFSIVWSLNFRWWSCSALNV